MLLCGYVMKNVDNFPAVCLMFVHDDYMMMNIAAVMNPRQVSRNLHDLCLGLFVCPLLHDHCYVLALLLAMLSIVVEF
jgi:hypothetical protein